MKDKLKIMDNTFSHSVLGYCSDYQQSDLFIWDRENININGNDKIIFTDNFLSKPNNKEISYAWLIEPIEISPNIYTTIINNKHKFKKIFTHEKTLIDLGEPFSLVPFGCCWIKPEDHQIYNKTKNLSIISSNKTKTEGHKLRQIIVNKYESMIDVYGRGHNPIDYKLEGIKDYRFSIVIENCKRDYWFTEKLIDCFVTGTIPIYWGCPSIGDFFDVDGLIIINNVEDLGLVIGNLNEEFYKSKKQSILNNFYYAKKYLLPDNLVYDKIKNDE